MSIAYGLNFYSDLMSWSVNIYKIYYFSSMVLVLLLGLGTAYIFQKKWKFYFLIYSILISLIFAIFDFTSNVNYSLLLQDNLNSMPNLVVMLSLLLVIPGSMVLIIGAYYSAFKLRKNRDAIIYNSLIGTGALVYSAIGSAAMFNIYSLYYIGQLVGLLLMFIGFLKSINVFKS
ncbi:MAG: hypothetical protein ACP5F1_06420 [Thermoplasmata archaeon]|nr:hypothetical protein [Thermoplasmata archaeon]